MFLFAESRTSDLDGATVNEQFNAGDEACIFGGEKDRRLRDLFWPSKAAGWYVRGELGIWSLSVCANPLSPGVSTGTGLTTLTLIFPSLRVSHA